MLREMIIPALMALLALGILLWASRLPVKYTAPKGWKWVPLVPTDAMLQAVHDGPLEAGDQIMTPDVRQYLIACYCVAVDAAPSFTSQPACPCGLPLDHCHPDCPHGGVFARGVRGTYAPNREAVQQALDLVDRIRDSHANWGGWSGIPQTCERITNMLRYGAADGGEGKTP